MNPRYAAVAARAGHRCEYCRAPEVLFNFPFEVEHIVPPRRGGADVAENWALSCRSCNVLKSAFLSGIDPESGEEVRLFQPREDAWDDHFRAEVEDGTIVGRTAVGRATVARLGMNREAQRSARRQWARLELFP